MAEYIEREKAYEKCGWYNTVNGKSICAARKDELAAIPSADVAPVRHARWEVVVGSDGKEHMVCTVCRKQQDLTGVFSYCPNCGAKMDKEDT